MQFKPVRSLGVGGFAEASLYQAENGRQLVLKVMKPDDGTTYSNIEKRNSELAKETWLQNKAYGAAPKSVLPVLGMLRLPNDELAVIMEYAPNGTLENAIKKLHEKGSAGDYITRAEKLSVQCGENIVEMHKAKIAHRDISPANVFMNEDNAPLLGDFGRAALGTLDEESPNDDEGLAADFKDPARLFGFSTTPQHEDGWGYGVTLCNIYANDPQNPRPFSTSPSEAKAQKLDFLNMDEEKRSEWLSNRLHENTPKGVLSAIQGLLAPKPEERITVQMAVDRIRVKNTEKGA